MILNTVQSLRRRGGTQKGSFFYFKFFVFQNHCSLICLNVITHYSLDYHFSKRVTLRFSDQEKTSHGYHYTDNYRIN